jgi:hypothetical protein
MVPVHGHSEVYVERYHFEPIDRGISFKDTPLARHAQGRLDLVTQAAVDFGVSPSLAARFLKEAWQEVAL